MSIEWSDAYLLSIDEIDDQHKMFFGVVRSLSDHGEQPDSEKKSFGDRMLFLKQYALEHFDAEEQFMELHEYPEFISHCQLHVDFIKQYSDLMDENAAAGAAPELEKKIFEFSRDWLIQHITNVDVRYAKYVINKNAG